jgi:adenylyltransferase/sulfurtransferase
VPSCAEGGVLGVLPGIVGTMQATEAIKLICEIGEPLVGRLLHFDALRMKFREFKLRRDPQCPVCGDHPTITQPIDYEQFCGMSQPSMPEVPSMTVHELKSHLNEHADFLLLDVREPHEYEIARIQGSKLIPLGEVEQRLEELPRDRKIAVHCKSGGRSAKAVGKLRDAGYTDVWNVTGGITAWSDEIDPSVPKY